MMGQPGQEKTKNTPFGYSAHQWGRYTRVQPGCCPGCTIILSAYVN